MGDASGREAAACRKRRRFTEPPRKKSPLETLMTPPGSAKEPHVALAMRLVCENYGTCGPPMNTFAASSNMTPVRS